MKYPQRVLLNGYSRKNLGDDLFFKIILDRYPKSLFILPASNEYKKIFSDNKNLIVINTSSFLYRFIYRITSLFRQVTYYVQPSIIMRILNFRFRFTHIVQIGGSMFIEDDNSDKGKVALFNYSNARRYFSNCHYSIIGCNFGPFHSEMYKENISNVFSLMDDVCFRDNTSYSLFKHVNNVRYANDIVFHMHSNLNLNKDKTIGLSILRMSNRKELKHFTKSYRLKLMEIIDEFQSYGYKIILMSFCEYAGDFEEAQNIYKSLRKKDNVSIFNYDGNISSALSTISTMEYMVASRFHAVILSLLFKVKVFPVAYSNKTKDMLSNYNLWKEVYSMESFTKMKVSELKSFCIEDFNLDEMHNEQFAILDKQLS